MNQRMREKLTSRNIASHPEPFATTTKKPVNTIAPFNTGGSVNNSAHVATTELPTFTLTEKLRMMHDVVAGILFLHQQGYVHCDIKSPNFLVANVGRFDLVYYTRKRLAMPVLSIVRMIMFYFRFFQDFTVKVADLGEAREMHETCETEDLPSPALNWAPPEVRVRVVLEIRCDMALFLNFFVPNLFSSSTDA